MVHDIRRVTPSDIYFKVHSSKAFISLQQPVWKFFITLQWNRYKAVKRFL